MRSWRRVFTSEEARIESLAGACPPAKSYQCEECGETWSNAESRDACGHGDWPQPLPPPFAADDEDLEGPNE